MAAGNRLGAYEIPSYQIALMWRRIAAKKASGNAR